MNAEALSSRRVSKRTLQIENEEYRLINSELEDKLSRSQSREATYRDQVRTLTMEKEKLEERLEKALEAVQGNEEAVNVALRLIQKREAMSP